MNTTMMNTTMGNNTSYVKDARQFASLGDILPCVLTSIYDNVGTFANGQVEIDGHMVLVSGLFKGYFGAPGETVWGEVMNFDRKGKIAFELREDPTEKAKREEEELALRAKIQEELRNEMAQEQQRLAASYEAELNKAKEAMRCEFESKLKAVEERAKEEFIQEETKHMVKEIAKITGVVSPKAEDLLHSMFEKTTAAEIGKALAVVAVNHDSSYDFVSKMENILWGCL